MTTEIFPCITAAGSGEIIGFYWPPDSTNYIEFEACDFEDEQYACDETSSTYAYASGQSCIDDVYPMYGYPDSTAILNIDCTSIIKVEIGVKGYIDERFNYCYAFITCPSSAYNRYQLYRIPLDTTEGTFWFDVTSDPSAPTEWTLEEITQTNFGLLAYVNNPFGRIGMDPTYCYINQMYWRITYG